jgi:NAD(P)-dependent dehydrogenase (short-subunit alcohol dehydrogenase family)
VADLRHRPSHRARARARPSRRGGGGGGGGAHDVEQPIRAQGARAVSVVSDRSDVTSARRAAAEIATLGLPTAGPLNNAGVGSTRPSVTAQGGDTTVATSHLGPFALTEALLPHLKDGANVVFVCPGVEDPKRRPAVAAGFRGARYISAEGSARDEWDPGAVPLTVPIAREPRTVNS